MRPSPLAEQLAGLLLPAAVRDEVLGDLHERFRSTPQYFTSILRLLPMLYASRIRRTADPQLTLIIGGLWYAAYLATTWPLTPPPSLTHLAGPTLIAQATMLLADTYSAHARPLHAPILAALAAILLSPGTVTGAAIGCVAALALRRWSPPPEPKRRRAQSAVTQPSLLSSAEYSDTNKVAKALCISAGLAFGRHRISRGSIVLLAVALLIGWAILKKASHL